MIAKIRDGALIGLGFMAVFFGLSILVTYGSEWFFPDNDPLPTYDQIAISNDRLAVLDGKIAALFQIENTEKEDCRENFRVQLTLLDAQGGLLDVCTSDVIISMAGFEKATRKLVCASIADVPMDSVSSHRLEVVGAW